MIDFHVLVSFDELNLVVLQQDIRAVEVIEDVQTKLEAEEAAAGIMGWISFADQQYPVFSLDKELNLLPYLPDNRHLCVLLQAGEEAVVGLTCSNVESLDKSRHILHQREIPVCMQLKGSPIEKLGIYDKKLVCISSAMALMKYLTAWAEARLAVMEENEEL